MGGSSYNVGVGSASGGRAYSNKSHRTFSDVSKAHKDVLPSGELRVHTDVKHPIIIGLDVTGSMGDNAKIIFDKMPMLWGQLEQKNYLTDMAVSFTAIGDAYTDEAPLQVTQFEQGIKIHDWLKKIWLEGAGGGQTMESYDLAALFYTTRCSVPNMEHGFFFFIGDEGFYPELDGNPTIPIFKKLMDTFDTFFIHQEYNSSRDDARIVAEWKSVMGERFIILKEPKAIVDVIIGLIAMKMNQRTFSEYEEELKERGQSKVRINNVRNAIKDFSPETSLVKSGNGSIKSGSGPVLLANRNPFRKRI